jgi:tetratricopeptide (TPR) repeat protein
VLAGPTASTEISYHAGCRNLGTLYWENSEGLKKAAWIFAAANPAQARSLLEQAGVTHLVLPGWSDFSEAYANLLAQSGETKTPGTPFFRDLLEKDVVPDWLRPLAYPIPNEAGLDAKSVRIFLLAPEQSPAEANYHRGLYYEESGLIEQAVEAYRRAANLDPGNSRAAEALGRLQRPLSSQEGQP